MNSTNIKYLFLIVIVALSMQSCMFDDDVRDLGEGPMVVRFANSSETVTFEQSGEPTMHNAPIEIVGARNEPLSTDVTVDVAVAANSEAQEGVDFEFSGGTSVTIPAGEMMANLVISIINEAGDPENPKTLVLEVASVNGPVTIANPNETNVLLQAE